MNILISFLPKSLLGKWSIGLALGYILLFVLSDMVPGPGPGYNTALAITLSVTGTGIALAALVTGLFAIIKNKDGSVLVFVAAFVGFYSAFGTAASLFGFAK